jgi:hypothetical protein
MSWLRAIIGLTFMLAIVAVFIKGSRTARAAALWILLALVPYQAIQGGGLTLRYLYAPACGLSVLVAEGLWWLFRTKVSLARWPVTALLACAMITASDVFEAHMDKLTHDPSNRLKFEKMVERIEKGPVGR